MKEANTNLLRGRPLFLPCSHTHIDGLKRKHRHAEIRSPQSQEIDLKRHRSPFESPSSIVFFFNLLLYFY
ncbi:hypothetical protein L2E82_02681 [Cichorium intybus]|uniref:Uncharacterized protein n=1 Tax=Cichorium intybus TaxID=13427 RepID=A0ACB9H2B2_CICIN|nr:hypothetical protein L2E82_02681 [Cichorium intybus]